MFYYLYHYFGHDIFWLNIFRYITFRSGAALLTSLLISFMIAPKCIEYFRLRQHGGQPIRKDGPESHLKTKQGIPTMGGAIMLIAFFLSLIFWADLSSGYVYIVAFVTLIYGLLGFVDDFLKVTKRNTKGVSGKTKLIVQFFTAFLACWWTHCLAAEGYETHLVFPFFKDIILDLGWFYFLFAAIVVVGASNAVNLTDGLDGLATGPIVIAAACFAVISYLVGNAIFANYLIIHPVPGAGEITVLCAALIGAGLGFLWYNAPPAHIFMGDTGSLALGGTIGMISVITKHEIVLAIIGGLFVIEALSVIIQVYYYKLTGGKRFFKMAPIHHHFEKCGWSETKIVIRFWIIAIIFALIGLSTLKLR